MAEPPGALAERYERLLLALLAGGVGTWELDLESGRLELSPDLARMYGLDPEELDGSPEQVLERIHPEDRAGLLARGTEAIQRGERYRTRHRAVLPGGEVRWIESFAHVIVEGQPRAPLRMTGISMDVTQRMAMSDRVWRGETYYRAIVENSADLIGVLERSGRTRYLSGGYARLLDYPAAELDAVALLTLVHEDDAAAVRAAFAEAVKTPGARRELELRLLRRDGLPVTVRAVISNMLNVPEVAGMVINVRDVTELAALEGQLRQAQKMEAVGRLAAAVAHDFNNLLTIIQGCGSFLLEAGGAVAEDAGQILKAAEDGGRLTRQLLRFGRQHVARRQVVEPAAAVEEVEAMLRHLLSEDITFSVSAAVDAGRVEIDPGELQQVIINLVLNARDALVGRGRVTVSVAARDVTEPLQGATDRVETGRYVELAVSDSGTGMSADTLSRIFEPFFTTKRARGGTGLGLATVYGIVKQHGGSILVESRRGEGSTFRVFLPRVEASLGVSGEPGREADGERAPETARQAVARRTAAGNAASAAGEGETVLLVEDDGAVRSLVGRMLRRAGYTVREASDGAGALRIAGARGPLHLVLTDMVLPDLGGPELVARIQEAHPGTPVVYMSGYAPDQLIERGIGEHAADYLEKPFDLETLGRVVAAALQGRG
ncbi:MAG: PAS domain-containing protein [Gemmatimonadota bacterium]